MILSDKKSVLFVDESGVSNLSDKRSRYFILTGILFNSSNLGSVNSIGNYFKHVYLNDLNFHAYDVLEKNVLKLSFSKRREIISEMMSLLRRYSIEFNVFIVDKDYLRKSISDEHTDHCYKVGFVSLLNNLAVHMQKNSVLGEVRVETRRSSDISVLHTLHECLTREAGRIQPLYQDYFIENFTSITFSNKADGCFRIELADLISFISYQKYHRTLSSPCLKGLELGRYYNREILSQIEDTTQVASQLSFLK